MASGATLRLDAGDVDALGRALALAVRRARNPRDLLEAAADAGRDATRRRIIAGGPAPDGSRWAPRAGGGSKPPLNRVGHLRDSIAASATSRRARWGSGLVYARIHQLGGLVRPRRRRVLRFAPAGSARPVFARQVEIPARPYLGVGELEERHIAAVAEAWLARVTPGGGR